MKVLTPLKEEVEEGGSSGRGLREAGEEGRGGEVRMPDPRLSLYNFLFICMEDGVYNVLV